MRKCDDSNTGYLGDICYAVVNWFEMALKEHPMATFSGNELLVSITTRNYLTDA
jgi:hypothetical protein